jgi:hypothetical protein
MADEGAELGRLQGVEFDVNSSWQPGVIVDPRSGIVTFKEVEVSAWGDMDVPEHTSGRWASRRKAQMTRISAANVPPDVKQFAETIGSYAKRAFPEGYFSWKVSGLGGGAKSLFFVATTQGKKDWANGIMENDPSFSRWVIHGDFTDEGLAPKMAIQMIQGGSVHGPNYSDGIKVGWRKKTPHFFPHGHCRYRQYAPARSPRRPVYRPRPF